LAQRRRQSLFPRGAAAAERHGMSHLRIWAPTAEYMLAMKCISARFDTHDKDDVIFLIRLLKLKKTSQVFSIIEKYYPHSKIPSKTQFLIEEVMEPLK